MDMNLGKFWEMVTEGSLAYCSPWGSQRVDMSLLLGRKAMTNLGSILKSRNIALPTKVHLVKAMVFPVIMYGCESWTIKKAEEMKNCGVGEDS